MMQQHVEVIQNLQQHWGRIVNPEANEYGNEDFNNDQNGYGDGGNGNEKLLMGLPINDGPGIRGNPQPHPIRKEYLCERLSKMKPPSFEGSAKPLDVEEWHYSM